MTLPFTVQSPGGVAVDASGDLFATDRSTFRVLELPAGGNQVTLPFSGLGTPGEVAIDGSGDVFVADQGNNRVLEVPAGGAQARVMRPARAGQ